MDTNHTDATPKSLKVTICIIAQYLYAWRLYSQPQSETATRSLRRSHCMPKPNSIQSTTPSMGQLPWTLSGYGDRSARIAISCGCCRLTKRVVRAKPGIARSRNKTDETSLSPKRGLRTGREPHQFGFSAPSLAPAEMVAKCKLIVVHIVPSLGLGNGACFA